MNIFRRWTSRADGKGEISPRTASLGSMGLQEAVIVANLAHPAAQGDTRLYGAAMADAQMAAYPQGPQLSVVDAEKPPERPLRLSEAELERLCDLYGRAILIEICKNPSHFGLDEENDSLNTLFRQARLMQAEFWEALNSAGGDITEVADPSAAVWRTAADLTALDWTARNCRRPNDGSV